MHCKRCSLLNVGGFYDPRLALFDGGRRNGLLATNNRAIVPETAPAVLLNRLAVEPAPATPKWIDLRES